MASSGPLNPGTMDTAPWGTEIWHDINDAKIQNNIEAWADITVAANVTEWLKASNFGFAIPAGSTINGIICEIYRRESSGAANIRDESVNLIKPSGVMGVADKAAAVEWPTTGAYRVYGSASDLWSEAWTPADINHVNFGFAVAATSIGGTGQLSVDHMRMTVHYTLTGAILGTRLNTSLVEGSALGTSLNTRVVAGAALGTKLNTDLV